MIRERFSGEEPERNDPSQQEEIIDINFEYAKVVAIFFRSLGEGADSPWPVPEVKKAINGLIDVLKKRQELCTKFGFTVIVKIDQMKISGLEAMQVGLNEQNLSEPGTLNQMKMVFS